MSDKVSREEVLRAYDSLRAELSALASLFTNWSFFLHGKIATLAIQASSELCQAMAHIQRRRLKSGEDISFIKDFISLSKCIPIRCLDLLMISALFTKLYNGVKKEGHKELAGHIKGVSTYLKKWHKLSVKLKAP